MASTTQFLKNLFVRRNKLRRRSLEHFKSHLEQFENRIALAVDVVTSPVGGGGESWVTVMVSDGDDVYLKMDANDLRIANNASFFSGENSGAVIPQFNANYDALYVYNGVVVERSLQFPADSGYRAGSGLLPTDYADAIEDETLTFAINSGITPDIQNFNAKISTGGDSPSIFEFEYDATTQTYSPINSAASLDVSYLRFGELIMMRVKSPALANAGGSAMPTIEIELGTTGTLFGGIIASNTNGVQRFKLFDSDSHSFMPGSLSGEIEIYFDDYNGSLASRSEALKFQVDTTGTGRVPISFANRASDMVLQASGLQTVGTSRGISDADIRLSGVFDTDTGTLEIRSEIEELNVQATQNRAWFNQTLPLTLNNINIGVQDRGSSSADLLGTQSDNKANNLVLSAGGTFTAALVVELPNTGSEISIDNPVDIDSQSTNGNISLAASRIDINSPVRADGQFLIPSGGNTRFGTLTEVVSINAPIGSPVFDIRLSDDTATDNITRSSLKIAKQASLSNHPDVLNIIGNALPQADRAVFEIDRGDAFISGVVAAAEQIYVMRSEEGTESVEPYILSTATPLLPEGSHGEIVGGTLSMLLANDTFGTGFETFQTLVSKVDIHTSVDRLRMQAASRQGNSAEFPFPYDIKIRESDDLIIDAVSSSSGEIDIEADGTLNLLAAMNSMGNIKLQSGNAFNVNAPITTSFGSIELQGPEVNVESQVRIFGGVSNELVTDISIEATDGALVLQDTVSAINNVNLSASGANGAVTGDGLILADGVIVESTGDVSIQTDASVVSVNSSGVVKIEDKAAAAFEVTGSPDVTLTAGGLDTVVPLGSSSGLSPALYGDVSGASRITVSAPRGSIDVLHTGSQTLEIGNAESNALPQDVDSSSMEAAGSLSIKSLSAQEIIVSDAPRATSGSIPVRFATSAPFNKLISGFSFAPAATPGEVPTKIVAALEMDSTDKSVDVFGGVIATDIRLNDSVLVKDGVSLYSVNNVEILNDSNLKMPQSFEPEVDITNKPIRGNKIAQGTKIASYDPVTKQVVLTKALEGEYQAGDLFSNVHVVDEDSSFCNDIYKVTGINFPVTRTDILSLELKRDTNYDTTSELAGRKYIRVTDGATHGNSSMAGKVFVSEGFLNNNSNFLGIGETLTPLAVLAIPSRAGYITANAITTGILPAEQLANGNIRAVETGAIGFDTQYFDGVVLGLNRRVLVQSRLSGNISPNNPGTSHFGVYEVIATGEAGQKWELKPYVGIDEDGDNQIDPFHTGVVAITQGTLRTTNTGNMYAITYDSINRTELKFDELTDFRRLNTPSGGNFLTEEFNPITQFRTEIGTRNVLGKVTYQVSSEAGTNDAPGSLGRILGVVLSNSAVLDRLGKAQLVETKFLSSVQKIQLEQELPEINASVHLSPEHEVVIDGSRITKTREGAVVRAGSLRSRLGPVSPSAQPSTRRLVRGVDESLDFEQVNGLEIGVGGAGSVIENLSIGGFSKGSAISIAGTDNVLLNNVYVGIDRDDNPMPNAIGIKIDQAMGLTNARFTTIKSSTIANNTQAAISLGTNVEEVRVVDSDVGVQRIRVVERIEDGIVIQEEEVVTLGNEAGVIIDTGESGVSHIGVRQINPAAAVVGLPVTPLESYPGYIGGVVPLWRRDPVVHDPIPTSRVSVAKNSATDSFEPGLQLFERTTNRMWTVREIELSTDELNYVMTVEGPQIDAASFGTPLALEAGYFVDVPQRAETLRLPAGVDPARLYLGQGLASTVLGAIESGTYITSITILPAADLPQDAAEFGHYGGEVEIGLSRPVALSAQTGLLFEPPGRNVVGFNNDGIILKSGSSSIISTDVTSSNFDGIRIEGVALNGEHIIGGAKGINLSSESVTISANLVSGLSFTESFFAGLAEEEKQAKFDQVKIRGNIFGTDLKSTPSLSNGRDGRSNIVITDASLEHQHQGKEDRDGTTGRYKARYRPEDNPNQLEELEEFEGFDTEGNNFFTGDPLTIPGPGSGFDGGGNGGGGSGFPTW